MEGRRENRVGVLVMEACGGRVFGNCVIKTAKCLISEFCISKNVCKDEIFENVYQITGRISGNFQTLSDYFKLASKKFIKILKAAFVKLYYLLKSKINRF